MSDAETEQLSEYEQLRNERIKRNEAKLEKLGLITLVADILQKQKKGKTKKKPRTKKRMVKAGQERRSARLKRKADGVDDAEDQDHVMLSYDSDDFIEDESKPAPRSRRLKLDDFIVNPKELKALEKHIDKNYLGKFREFLKCVDNISDPNEKNVMRQITKLANGEGVRYTSPQFGWPEGCYFMKGEPVTPISDVVELLNEAQKCEDEWGRDHGNGWLLRHPLKKLLMFQQFCLRQPAFLKSKCKLPQYCEEVERRAEKDTGNKKSGNRRVSQSKSAVSKLKKEAVPTVQDRDADGPSDSRGLELFSFSYIAASRILGLHIYLSSALSLSAEIIVNNAAWVSCDYCSKKNQWEEQKEKKKSNIRHSLLVLL